MTRGQLPQRAGSLGLNGGGAAAAVPPPIDLFSAVGRLGEFVNYDLVLCLLQVTNDD